MKYFFIVLNANSIFFLRWDLNSDLYSLLIVHSEAKMLSTVATSSSLSCNFILHVFNAKNKSNHSHKKIMCLQDNRKTIRISTSKYWLQLIRNNAFFLQKLL